MPRNISSLLKPKEVRTLLQEFGIKWDPSKVGKKGWVVIKSPFREDKKPSFSVNINHGSFCDFGTNIKGDIQKLTSIALNRPEIDALDYIDRKFNIKFYR